MESYGAANMCTWTEIYGTWEKNHHLGFHCSPYSDLGTEIEDHRDPTGADPELAGVGRGRRRRRRTHEDQKLDVLLLP